MKTDLFDRKLRFNLTGFYGILRNAQIGHLDLSGCQSGGADALRRADQRRQRA